MKRTQLKDHETDQSQLKKNFILYLWRMQESQTIIAVLFYSLSLTGIYLDKAVWYFEEYLSISSITTITLILACFTFLFILFLGYIYDRVFNLWKHKNVVMMKKNIFLSTHLTPKERTHFSDMWLPIVKVLDDLEGKGTLKETIGRMERWKETGSVYESTAEQEERSSN